MIIFRKIINNSLALSCFKTAMMIVINIAAFLAHASESKADNIQDALARSYLVNPQLNAQRANTRSVDELLPQARGQWMPQATGQATAGIMNQNLLSSRYSNSAFGGIDGIDQKTITNPVGATFNVSMNIFNGFRGVNGINQAEAQIHQSRELLRNSEMTILNQAATAYMNLLKDAAVYDIRADYVKVYEQQVEDTKDRLKGGEATITDVYQSQSYLSQAKEERVSSFIQLQASIANYKQIIQSTPVKLAPAMPLDHLIPKTINDALKDADAHHPLAVAARYNVDVSKYAVKIAEGQLAPTVNLQTSVGQNWNYFGTTGQRLYQGSGSIQMNVPLYEGGVYYSQVRQAKEKYGEAQLLFDQQINQIHQQIETYWAQWQNASKALQASREHVKNAESALAGLREEIKYGTRSTMEVLYYHQMLANARVIFVNAQRDRVLSCYNLLYALGDLSGETLGLNVPKYQVTDHYDRVKNQFFGLEPWK